ncbi:NADH-ubiquinone oxidoreductase-F iron-sulfur binding region domain-containing protein [Phycicoccus duodecadis]|uniref:NADH:ubiquinone oxidoreductase subunit F (NADH-binding) n=1 Tax=Phycicoccus duodecadis TaxID=173053 RepID=A0A2N3YFZ3_9MICO|nr:NADH-ubiquinone oxidoreductase-F iron-sulfur binding region domain-containing protein [Phycicoccus duodecadis]PKW25777.1 NADH:ubiquinone oxidoreductase subunit F (NADH-binding) [Phycicoccus duodecadis]
MRTVAPPARVEVSLGPLLLSGVDDGPGLDAHRARFGELPALDTASLVALADDARVRGRGGAGFPLGRKLRTVHERSGRRPSRRPVVVVNAAEGEPASAKDETLLRVAPHLVLDGAALAARALGARRVHVVVPADRPQVGAAVRDALAERSGHRERWTVHEAEGRFVAGQARAVLELMEGRPGLPVTAWAPEAVEGFKGRPTLLANAESWAHLGLLALVGLPRYGAFGTPDEPGTMLLTLTRPPGPDGRFDLARVVEVAHGDAASDVLDADALAAPLLVGGFHGAWLHPRDLERLVWTQAHLRSLGAALGAGALVSLAPGDCPVALTAAWTEYLAGESAGRCGPCRNGLPALAQEVRGLAEGADTRRRIQELTGLVVGRGACAHPDGTSRLVRSLLTTLGDRVEGHLAGSCGCAHPFPARVA